MRNDDLDRNMGGAGQKDQGNYGQGSGQQTPGRNKQDDEFSSGQRDASKQGEQKHMKDDFGTSGNKDAGQGGRDI
jgi:hypothetical protein